MSFRLELTFIYNIKKLGELLNSVRDELTKLWVVPMQHYNNTINIYFKHNKQLERNQPSHIDRFLFLGLSIIVHAFLAFALAILVDISAIVFSFQLLSGIH